MTGKLQRRIKHFSGYNVFAGNSCDASAGCLTPGAQSAWNRIAAIRSQPLPMLKFTAVKSGYMLAWA